MTAAEADSALRAAAFARCRELMQRHAGAVPWAAIQAGFAFAGERIYLGSTPRGIHRPRQLQRGALSVKTTKPKQGRSARYDDTIAGDGFFSYAFQGTDPNNHDNRALRESFEAQTPLIYFYALVPAVYQILFPCFITGWDPQALRCELAVGTADELNRDADRRVIEPIERRYSTVAAKQRLHQAEFRELVLEAYGRRCAISNLPVPTLLQAAHILPDRDERGRPEVSNGLCLPTLHHSAYDRNLLGIDPDGGVHLADALLAEHDGPTLEHALKGFHGRRIHLPRQAEDRPDRDFLAKRFEAFRASQ